MTTISYPATSAYSKTPQTSWAIGLYVHRAVAPDTTDTSYVIEPKYQYKPWRLAYDLYGHDDLYWVFMSRNLNVIRDPIWDMIAGTTIILPSNTYIKRIFGL